MYISRKRINELSDAVSSDAIHCNPQAMRRLDRALFELVDSGSVVKVRHGIGDVINNELLSQRQLWLRHNNRAPPTEHEQIMVIRNLANWGGEGEEEGEPEIEFVDYLQLLPSYTAHLEDANTFKWRCFGGLLQLYLSELRSEDSDGSVDTTIQASLVDREQQIRAVYTGASWALATVGATLQALTKCENLVDDIYDFVD